MAAEQTRSLPRLLKAEDVSNQTGLSLPRVYELARTGEMPVIRLGRSMRFDPAAVGIWLANGGSTGQERTQ